MAPNAFTNELAKWLYNKFIGSVVIVEFRKRDRTALKALWDKVSPIQGNTTEHKNARRYRTENLDVGSLCSTGCVVRSDQNEVLILTCAHVLEASFSMSSPITAEEVEQYFDVCIICDHREQRYISGTDVDRVYQPMRVRAISCAMDLMLLRLDRNTFDTYCPHAHDAIPMATSYPPPLERVAMLSWPPLSHRTAVTGETSHPSRLIRSANPQGFTCRVAEVNITSQSGSSGAPLISGAGEFLSLLQGGDRVFSFFVSFEDVRNTLMLWDVVPNQAV